MVYRFLRQFHKEPIFVYNDIPFGVLDRTVKLGHHGVGVVINKQASIGSYVVIGPNVTIGGKSVRKIHGYVNVFARPVIEDHVRLCANCCVIGPVTVGHHSVVAPGAVVHKDVPPYSLVVGDCRIFEGKYKNKNL